MLENLLAGPMLFAYFDNVHENVNGVCESLYQVFNPDHAASLTRGRSCGREFTR